MNLKLAVLDARYENAYQAIRSYLSSRSAKGEDLPFLPPWTINTGEDDSSLDVHCEFVDDPDVARKLLLAPDRSREFDLILLSTAWGGDKSYGTDLLKMLTDEALPHPLLVLYSEDQGDHIALAIEIGLLARTGTAQSHRLSTLLLARSRCELCESTFQSKLSDVTLNAMHYIKNFTGPIGTQLQKIEKGAAQVHDPAAQKLGMVRRDLKQLESMAEFWVNVKKQSAGKSDRPPGVFGEAASWDELVKLIEDKLETFWQDQAEHLAAKTEAESRRAYQRTKRAPDSERPQDPAKKIRALGSPPRLTKNGSRPSLEFVLYDDTYLNAMLGELVRNALLHGDGEEQIDLIMVPRHTSDETEQLLWLEIANARGNTAPSVVREEVTKSSVGLPSMADVAQYFGVPTPRYDNQDARRFVITIVVAKAVLRGQRK